MQTVTDNLISSPDQQYSNKSYRVQHIVRLLWVLLIGTPLAHADDVREFRLENGMKVLVQVDKRAPVVVSQLWYRVGSMDEVSGKTGLAHMLEHMMFTGTRKVKNGEFSRLIAQAGGRENAFTGRDYTVYHQQLEKSRLELALQLEADRMMNLQLNAAKFAKELNVVKEERRWRTEDSPQGIVYENFNAVFYQTHPYRNPIVGWMGDLDQLKIEDVQSWYQTWYAPNNATLIVVGDVEPDQVFTLVKKYFTHNKPHALPDRNQDSEPKQVGEKIIHVKAPAKLAYLLMGYHVPSLQKMPQSWEPYALDVLAGILDGNESARLNQVLVRQKQLAVSAAASYGMIHRGSDVSFLLEATLAEGVTSKAVELALLEEISKIQRQGVTEEELQRIKAQVLARNIYQRDSNFYQAMQLGMYENAGLGWQRVEEYIHQIQNISAEQVQIVARRYLIEDNRTIAILDPQPLTTQSTPPQGMRHAP